MPKVSVVMSVYNGEKYLRSSIESILRQTYSDLEFIIINDGSTDTGLDIINEYAKKDERIKLISRENIGLVYSLNEGIKKAQGEYIARMDADDIAMPVRLEKQLKYAQEEGLAVCGAWAEGIDDLGNKIKDMDYPPDTEKIRRYTLLHNPFIHPSVIFRKDIFEKVGGYRQFFKHIEDYELWTRMVFKYRTGNIPEKLLQYRLHQDQITNKDNLKMRLKGAVVRILALIRLTFIF
jgi:glycosyltransferase involved in cell wall biosynthesis